MRKRLENWLASVIRAELRAILVEMKEHSTQLSTQVSSIKSHVSAEAHKAIRKACSVCGQMTFKYVTDEGVGKIKCLDCLAKKAV